MDNKLIKSICWELVVILAAFWVVNPVSVDAAYGINRTINFQGKLVDAGGVNVANSTPVTATFSIYNANSSCPGGGTAVWSETQTFTPVDGIFQVALGSQTAFANSIDFSQDTLYLGIKVSTETNEMCMGSSRIKLAAVPYAFNAEKFAGLTADNSQSNYFTITGGQGTAANLKVSSDITVGSIITPTNAGGLTVQSNGANNLTFNSGGTSASALDLNATGIVAGNAITLDTTDGGIALTALGATNGDITISPTDDFNLNGTAGSLINIGTSAVTQTISIGAATNTDLALTDPQWSITGAGVASFVTGSVLGSQTFTTNNIADSGALTIKSAAGSYALTLDSGTTGDLNIGTGASGKTINVGTDNTNKDTINVGSILDDVAITSDQWSVTNNGILTVQSCIGCGTNPQTVRRLGANYTNATANFTTITDGTDNDDQDLTFQTGVSQSWVFEAVVYVSSPAAADMKFQVTAPTNAVCKIGFENSEDTVTVSNIGCGVTSGILNSDAAYNVVRINGTIVTDGTNSGKVSVQFGQQVASGTSTIQVGSYIIAEQVNGGTGAQPTTLTGDVTGSGTGSIATTIAADKVVSSMILDGTIVGGDLATNINISTTGNVTTTGTGAITSAGALSAGTSITDSGLTTAGVVTNTAAGLLGTLAGTATTVLHGNVSGAPSFSSVVGSDLDAAINISTSGSLTTTGTGVVTSAGAFVGPTATNTINNLVINNGALSNITTINASGQITSTLASGTAPFVVASSTNVANLNASSLNGATFASPGNIGTGTAGTGTFTSLTDSSLTNAGVVTNAAGGALSTLPGTAITVLHGNAGGAPSFSSITGSDLASNISLTTTGTITSSTNAFVGPTTGSTINGLLINAGDVTLASGKHLVVTGGAGDPTLTNGTIWYDTTANKYKIVENGTAKTLCNATDLGCGSAAAGITTVKENNVNVVTSALSANFASNDFVITDETGGQVGVAIDYANSGITRKAQADTVTGGWTFGTAATTFTSGIAANSASGITSNQATLVINAGGAVDIQDNVTVDNLTADTGNITISSGALVMNATTRISNTGVGSFLTGTTIGSQTFTTNNIADSGALTIVAGNASALTLVSGNNGAGAAGNISIDVGTSSAGNGSIQIGTANRVQTITMGNTAVASTLALNTGVSTTAGMTITAGSLTSGSGLRITSAGTITTGGELLDLVGNSATTGNLITLSASALTTGSAINITLPSGTSLGTGSGISGTATYTHTTGNLIGSFQDLTIVDNTQTLGVGETSRTRGVEINMTNSADASTGTLNATSGLSVTNTISTTGSTTKDINGVRILAPTISGCTGGTCNIDGFNIDTAAYTESANHTMNMTGFKLEAAGALIAQTTSGATINWDGAKITMPTITTSTAGTVISADGLTVVIPTTPVVQTAGTATMAGLNITSPATGPASGTLLGISIGNITTPGAGTEYGIQIGSGWDRGITTPDTTVSSGLTIQTGNSSGGAAGNLSLDVGTSSAGNGSILIGTANRAKVISIGQTGAGGATIDTINLNTTTTAGANSVVNIGTGTVNTRVVMYPRLAAPGAEFNVNGAVAFGSIANSGASGRIWVRSNGLNFRFNSSSNVADYSEFIAQSEPSEQGDIMVVDNDHPETVRKSRGQYEENILGVITITGTANNNGWCEDEVSCDRTNDPNWANIGMLGQVPVKVSTENGSIEIGDRLTTSSIPGVAMKATEAGQIIGRALENYSSTEIGKVKTLISPTYFDPARVAGNDLDQLKLQVQSAVPFTAQIPFAKTGQSNLAANFGKYSIQSVAGGILNTIGKFSSAVIANLKTGSVLSAEVNTDTLAANMAALGNLEVATINADTIKAKFIQVDEIVGLKEMVTSYSAQLFMDKVNAGLEIATPKLTADQVVVKEISSPTNNVVFNGGITADWIKVKRIEGLESTEVASRSAALVVTPTPPEETFLGKVKMSSGTVALNFTVFGDLIASNGLTVSGPASFLDKVDFGNLVSFQKGPIFNKDTVGFAKIAKDADRVEVVFDKEYSDVPVVTVSIDFEAINNIEGIVDDGANRSLEKKILEEDYSYIVTRKNKKGFTIIMNKPAVSDVNFSWTAFTVKDNRVFSSVVPTGIPAPMATIVPTNVPEIPITSVPATTSSILIDNEVATDSATHVD